LFCNIKKKGEITMLFLTYWELNEAMPIEQRLQITQKLTSMLPLKGVNIIQWVITPDAWGILLAEAESVADISQALDVWRVAGAGFFKSTRTAPAQSIQEAATQQSDLLKSLGSI
jgi:hypothetical protein